MAGSVDEGPLSEANLLALTGEEALEDIKELTLRNHKLQSFDHGEAARLLNLQVMSLSHNLLSSLAGFQHLKHLISLNLNFNALTSLEGISNCTGLQHLFLANNRVRDISPLVPCTNLHTLHLFRNNISNLDMTMLVLAGLPKLRELELAGNPCALAPEYKHRVVLQLDLQSLDGDTIAQLDYDMANEYFAANGGIPPKLGPRVDILTLEEFDGAAGAPSAAADSHAAAAAPRSASEHGASAGGQDPGLAPAAAVSDAAAALSRSGAGAGSGQHGADSNGRPSTSAWGSLPRPGSAAARAAPAGPGPGAAGAHLPPQLLPRPGTAARRPGSASGASGRPGSAYSGLQSSVQLLSNEILNDHPLIIEYLAKHVLMEGLALTEQQGVPGRPGSGGSAGGGGGGGGGGRGPSFAQRLRDTAAAMNACEDVDPKTLAGQQQELIATSQTVRLGMAEEMIASATPNELCRQLVRLCEVLIKEVEVCRAGRPPSSGSTTARPGTAAGQRPGTAAGLRPTTPGLHASSSGAGPSSSVLTPAEVGELVQMRADVERLCRENKALRLENENMYWLVEEVKRLKAERGGSAGK
ncbi:hypothetical protein PLESTB_001381000 [Pleodorina starrii]|uniref:Uncharacterized protein n=1 Tax=Pleodorina starrii TaxID=330485 RepID=A0A9W6F6Y9_9CHLO|nr:hypothetical protein PLESTM_000404200 [Pleodorina starrii]GLC58619.1 hypothetical protein PLESTB_001381000 [Pleodorina starrii]GLC67474.1 hypothetical protein PLESTF_000561400 [Pleodorina starrii]